MHTTGAGDGKMVADEGMSTNQGANTVETVVVPSIGHPIPS
jgi:hypothetical protein